MTVGVTSAGVSLAVLMIVMAAHNVGIEAESSCKISVDSHVSTAVYAAEKLNSCLSKSSLGTASDTAADENINAVHCQEACKSAVTASEGGDDFFSDDFIVGNVVNLELFSVTEMLKNLSVFIGNRNTH